MLIAAIQWVEKVNMKVNLSALRKCVYIVSRRMSTQTDHTYSKTFNIVDKINKQKSARIRS